MTNEEKIEKALGTIPTNPRTDVDQDDWNTVMTALEEGLTPFNMDCVDEVLKRRSP